MSVISLTLLCSMVFSNNFMNCQYDAVIIGGLNSTEFEDLELTFGPARNLTVVESFGFFSARWTLQNNPPENTPVPVHSVMPFLTRIKTYGYTISFYEISSVDPDIPPGHFVNKRTAIHNWILESQNLD